MRLGKTATALLAQVRANGSVSIDRTHGRRVLSAAKNLAKLGLISAQHYEFCTPYSIDKWIVLRPIVKVDSN
jgi:hypothetical protein